MKLITTTAVVLLTVWLCSGEAYADCPCENILEDGVRRHLSIGRTTTSAADFRAYLLSDRFESDLKRGALGVALTVALEGVPVTIRAGSSSSDVRTFQQQIQLEPSWTLSHLDFQMLVSSIPDSNIGQIYSDCISKHCSDSSGFRVESQVGDGCALFTLTYRKAFDAEPMPVVTSFIVINATVKSQPPAVNSTIQGSTLIRVTRDPKRELVLALNTDRGAVVYRIPANAEREPSEDMPVGTIVASLLNSEQFLAATGRTYWRSTTSRWSPADGREVPGSAFALATSKARVPDLRGLFLRGVNAAEPNVARTDEYADPEANRQAGSLQHDAFQGHGHQSEKSGATTHNPTGTFMGVNGGCDLSGVRILEPRTIDAYGPVQAGKETRPNNVAVFYYVRIN